MKICYSEGLFLILNNPKFERKYQILIIPLAKTKTKAKVKTMNTIDLSKCKVGQKLKTREGKEITLGQITSLGVYPYLGSDGVSRNNRGLFYAGKLSDYDIIDILPLEKKAKKKAKKKSKKKSKPSDKSWTAKQKAAIRQILKLVTELDEHINDVTK